MKASIPDRSGGPSSSNPLDFQSTPSLHQNGETTASSKQTAVLVGAMFLTATVTFAIGTARINSYFSSAHLHNSTLAVGALFLLFDGLAVAVNGLAMRPVLAPYAPNRSRTYLLLRLLEFLAVVAIGVYFLSSHSKWSAYELPVYAISGAAGLVLSSAMLTSRIIPKPIAMLGVIGYPIFLVGSILAMFNVMHVTHGPGLVALVPGGLFELILPFWLFVKGFRLSEVKG